jgi:hypothetical protein
VAVDRIRSTSVDDNSAADKFDNGLVILSSFVLMSLGNVTNINVEELAEDPLNRT